MSVHVVNHTVVSVFYFLNLFTVKVVHKDVKNVHNVSVVTCLNVILTLLDTNDVHNVHHSHLTNTLNAVIFVYVNVEVQTVVNKSNKGDYHLFYTKHVINKINIVIIIENMKGNNTVSYYYMSIFVTSVFEGLLFKSSVSFNVLSLVLTVVSNVVVNFLSTRANVFIFWAASVVLRSLFLSVNKDVFLFIYVVNCHVRCHKNYATYVTVNIDYCLISKTRYSLTSVTRISLMANVKYIFCLS